MPPPERRPPPSARDSRAHGAASQRSASGDSGSARRAGSTGRPERTRAWMWSLTSQTLTFMPASTLPPRQPEGDELARAPGRRGRPPRRRPARPAQPEYSMPRSYWSEKKYGSGRSSTSWPSIALAAAGPPSRALAQCSTRTRPSSGVVDVGHVAGGVDVRVGGPQRRVDQRRRCRRPARPASASRVSGRMPTPTTTRSAGTVGAVRQRHRASGRRRGTPTPEPSRRSTPCARCRSAKTAPSSSPSTRRSGCGAGLDHGDRGAVLAGGRGDLQPDPAGADDDDPAAAGQRLLAGRRRRPACAGSARRRVAAGHVQRADQRAGGQQQLVVAHRSPPASSTSCAAGSIA